jgi:predicted HicB family RNase H-like nuclease
MRSSDTSIGRLPMLTDTLSYKEYNAEISFDDSADEFHGRVIGINDVIDFYGQTPANLKQEFQNSIDEYLDWCQAESKEPDKSRPAIG